MTGGIYINAKCKMQISDTPRTRADRRCAIGKVEGFLAPLFSRRGGSRVLMQGSEVSRNAKLTTLPPPMVVPLPLTQGRLG